jgi:hypothetical protein
MNKKLVKKYWLIPAKGNNVPKVFLEDREDAINEVKNFTDYDKVVLEYKKVILDLSKKKNKTYRNEIVVDLSKQQAKLIKKYKTKKVKQYPKI